MPNSLKCRLKNLVRKGWLSEKDLERIVIIPIDATNEDVIKAMFPNSFFGDYVVMSKNICFDIDWLKASYKGVLE